MAFVQNEMEKRTILGRLPAKGNYTLRIFARDHGEESNYDWVADYLIRGLVGDDRRFPKVYDAFNRYETYLFEPLDGNLSKGKAARFKVSSPQAESIAVICKDEWIYLNETQGTFEGEVVPSEGEVIVAARKKGGADYDSLLAYTAS
jgi:hypothetical protein